MMKRIINTIFYVSVAIVLFSSCDKNDDTAPVYPTLDSYISSQSNLTVFKAAIEKAQLQTFRDGPGPFTWLAPTDAAFQAKGITLATINSLTAGQANYLLQYHLINARVTTTDMLAQNSFPRTTQLGASVYLGQLGDDFYVNGSKISSKDNFVSNGVVHIIDRPNTPPNFVGNIQVILSSGGQFSLFIAALTKAGRWAALGSASVFTVFAPTDAAMTAAGYTTASIAAASTGSIDSLVRYHMFSGARIFTNDIGNKTSPGTFLATTKTLVGSSNGTKIKGISNPTAVDITLSDILGLNGVVHVINGVLKY